MRRSIGVFNTDQPTRDHIIFPASALMNADLKHRLACRKSGLPVGLPAHIQHDMHRLTGWSRTYGLYFDNSMVRSLGAIEEAETDEEKEELKARSKQFWQWHHAVGAEPFKDEIITRAAPAALDGARFLRLEAAFANRSSVAAELYPDLFTPNTKWVDKDGLVDYRQLLNRTKEIQPGVFHEPERGLLLSAHRFFRRSLSHKNKLNSYFLQAFGAAAEGETALRARLRLDPDLVGHPQSAKLLIELEYWRGPQCSDDIADIPNGVTEHKASQADRQFEGIDRTQVWWKAPEKRLVDDEVTDYRTFEAEELIENPSGGLADGGFGCRYAHAEFSGDEAAITHFDGAIRAYAETHYLDRFEASIDRAGKNSSYTKIFRFDGSLKIANWKRLLSDFFRGNTLIPEYFGVPAESEGGGHGDKETAVGAQTSLEPTFPKLAAFVSTSFGHIREAMQLCADQCQQVGNSIVPYVEIGTGEVGRFLQKRIDFSDTMAVGITDGNLNLSRLGFGSSENAVSLFKDEVKALSRALRSDAEAGNIKRAAIPLCWNEGELLITITILGEALIVA